MQKFASSYHKTLSDYGLLLWEGRRESLQCLRVQSKCIFSTSVKFVTGNGFSEWITGVRGKSFSRRMEILPILAIFRCTVQSAHAQFRPHFYSRLKI